MRLRGPDALMLCALGCSSASSPNDSTSPDGFSAPVDAGATFEDRTSPGMPELADARVSGSDVGKARDGSAGSSDAVVRQGATPDGGYSLTNQPPASVAFYSRNASSVTTKKLPADIMTHCLGNTSCVAGDLVAKCAMLDCNSPTDPTSYNYSEISDPTYMGLFEKASPGQDDYATPMYYALPTDPWYSTSFATPTGSQAITFHAPSGAAFSSGTEHLLAVWDQGSGWVLGLYRGGSNYDVTNLPTASGCGDSSTTACPITVYDQAAAANLFTGQDYGYTGTRDPGYASNGSAPFASTLREEELMTGAISHAGMITVDCVNVDTPHVFPANQNPGLCGIGLNDGRHLGPQTPNRASAGMLLFCDYTPAQIAAFKLPAWQSTLLTQFCAYGDYVSESGGYGITLSGDENMESSEAWRFAYPTTYLTADPFWPWILEQKGLKGDANISETGCGGGSSNQEGNAPLSTYRCTGAFLANIPRAMGPGGSDAEGNSCAVAPGCYPSGHVHVADPCIAKGYAGVAGGCF